VKLVLVLDCNDPERLAHFWSQALGYRVSGSAGSYVVLVSDARDGAHPELVLQRVDESKTVKNRMHIDIRGDELEETVERLLDLGARQLEDRMRDGDGCRWMVMADPEGNEFCVCAEKSC
jgi:predicted enzyme related to lactoylglutathione lyase